MKKKQFRIGIVITVVIVSCIAIFVIVFNKKTNMVSVSTNEITSVIITNGNNGDMVELSTEEIDILVNLCSSIECQKMSREQSGGWSYSINIVYGNKSSKITLISSEICNINNFVYKIKKRDGEAVITAIKKFYVEKKVCHKGL